MADKEISKTAEEQIQVEGPASLDDDVCQAGLPKIADDVPVNVWLVAIVSGGERLAWYGATGPFQNYLQNGRDAALPGAMGLQQDTATLIMAAFFAVSYFSPVPGAIISDAVLGRFWTIYIAAIFILVGSIILFVTSLPSLIQQSSVAACGLIVTMVLYALASGTLRAAISPFVADQYSDYTPRIKLAHGKRHITSRELTIEHVYNIFYWSSNIAGLGALATTVLERHVGFWAAFILPLVGIGTSCAVLTISGHKFVRTQPKGSVLINTGRAMILAARCGFDMDSSKPQQQLSQHNRSVSWDERFIDELKLALLACRIFLLFPFQWLCYNQTFNNLISQAGQMQTFGVPNDSIKSINPLSSILIYPLLDRGIYPYLRQRGIKCGPIAKISAGFAVLTLAMTVATIVQNAVYIAGPCYKFPRQCSASENGRIPNQVNVFIQFPIYILGATAEALCLPSAQELAYNQAPQNMRAMTAAVSMAMAGIGALLAMAFTPLAYDPFLVIMYASLAGLMSVVTVTFWLLFHNVDKKELEIVE